ncbi:MAG TPA: DinB family protein [Candidatus Dormibacteraeota bacterium]|nr:DinB family protein [Candidatus Dormibacteraeota bacterium]
MHPVLALFKRNAWATEQLLEFCAGRPELTAPAEDDVYGTIEATFNHIVGAEAGYARLITGHLPVRVRESRAAVELLEPGRLIAEGWLEVLSTERDLEVVLPFQRGRDPEVMSDWLPLVQCVHHGDDHRAQIGTLLSRHGIEPPDLDGWSYGEVGTGDAAPHAWWDALLGRFFRHHFWATEQLLERCRDLSPEQLAFSAPGTYGSIEATLDHLVSADRTIFSRATGGGRQPALDAGGPGPLLEHFARQRQGWEAYLASKPDFESRIDREGVLIPVWVIVLQAIHHGNDHRTNVGTALLRQGLEAPEIDVWAYAWQDGALRPLPAGAGPPPAGWGS